MENEVKQCITPCHANTGRGTVEPLHMSDLPREPWLNLSVDFCEPLPSGDYLMVIVDEYSRSPVVEVVHSTSSEVVIPVEDRVFSFFEIQQSSPL